MAAAASFFLLPRSGPVGVAAANALRTPTKMIVAMATFIFASMSVLPLSEISKKKIIQNFRGAGGGSKKSREFPEILEKSREIFFTILPFAS